MNDENIVYQARLSLLIFLHPVLMLLAAIYVYFSFYHLKTVALIFIFVSLAWAAITVITYQYSSLTVTKTQIILRRGFLIRETIGIAVNKIESVDITQSIIGSIFKYGTIVVTGTGGTRQMMGYIDKPLTCRRYIEQLLAGY